MIAPQTPSFSYKRPEQVRTIPLKASSYRGMLTTTKLHLQKRERPAIIAYESALERDLFYCLDHDYYCYDFQPQPVEISWTDKEGKQRLSYPDCWAVFLTGKQILYQVKPTNTLQKLTVDEKWTQELKTLENYCKSKNWELKIVSEAEIRTPRLQNICMLRGAVQHPPRESVIERAIDNLPSIFEKGIGKTVTQLEVLLSKLINVSIQSALHIIQYLLYYQILAFDWNSLLNKAALVCLNSDYMHLAEPFYEIKPLQSHSKTSHSIPVKIDLQVLSPGQIDETNRRYEAIKDLLEKPERTEEDIQQKAKELGKSSRTIYRWIRAYEEGHWRGLVKRTDKRGNYKSRFPFEIEEIIQKTIARHLKEQSSIKACWEDVKQACEEIDITNPPAYFTIRDRIRKLPAHERKGKQGGYIRHEMPQSIMGELPTGNKPLNLIQMDHTLLDIVLVDQQFRKPIGRPWLTLAIDTYSRMIYGYFLSFSNPSSLSVTSTLMNGFLPKTEPLQRFNLDAPYPIQGLPKRLQIDNSREFRSKHLEQFCLMYRIDLEFRPVRRPDKGAYIERLFGTVNRVIRDERLPGYAPPLKSRPENYDPDKVAEKNGLTLPEFEKWLLHFIVHTYHTRIHSGLDRSPLEQYQIGVGGLEGSLGANPIIPDDLTKLKFDILPLSLKKHGIHAYGIRWLGNNYNGLILAKMRKDFRGKPPKIHFRFDPADIRQIWIYDSDDHCYWAIPITGGRIHRFVKYHPEISISLSEFQKISKNIRKERKLVNDRTVERGILERKELLEQSHQKSKRARKELAKQREKRIKPQIPVISLEKQEEQDDDDDEAIAPFPTEWDDAKKSMEYWDDLQEEESE